MSDNSSEDDVYDDGQLHRAGCTQHPDNQPDERCDRKDPLRPCDMCGATLCVIHLCVHYRVACERWRGRMYDLCYQCKHVILQYTKH